MMTMGRKAQGCHFHFDIYAKPGKMVVNTGGKIVHIEFVEENVFKTKLHERKYTHTHNEVMSVGLGT